MEWTERFWSKVDKSGTCWLWTGGLTPAGYGKFWLDGKTVLAHRTAYVLTHGPIPDGQQLDHLCRVRHCVRHLEPVTIRENLRRGATTLAAINAAKSHCANGHEFNDANTYVVPSDGSRMCRVCMRARDRARYWKARASK